MTADKKSIFLYYWRLLGSGEEPVPEYRFGAMACGGPGKGLKERLKGAGLHDWRFDYCWPQLKVFVEVEGGVFAGGRHTRGRGYSDDLEKYNTASSMNWLGFRFTPDMIETDPVLCVAQVRQGLYAHQGTLKHLEV